MLSSGWHSVDNRAALVFPWMLGMLLGRSVLALLCLADLALVLVALLLVAVEVVLPRWASNTMNIMTWSLNRAEAPNKPQNWD